MNEQATHDNSNNPNAPTILPAKRRRGRPRKDGSVSKRGNLQSPVMTTSVPENIKKVQQNAVEVIQKDGIMGVNNGVGQMVSGVVDGRFDAGYFITVRVGNSGTTLRGLVFQPGRFAPITRTNDVAPTATLYHRNQVASPLLNQLQQEQQQQQQPNVASFVPNCNQFAPVMPPPNEARCNLSEKIMLQPLNQDQTVQIQSNLNMVEQDEMMQVFEVSNQSQGVPKASQNQLMDTMFKSQNALDNQSIESGFTKKLEIHRGPMNVQTQLYSQGLTPMNADILCGQENTQNQFNQSSLFGELNSASPAAETQVQPNNELKTTFLEMTQTLEGANDNPNPGINQVLVAGDQTQSVDSESIKTSSMDFMMENLNYPKNDESNSTHIGTEVELPRNVEISNETKEASDQLVLGSQLAPQQEEAARYTEAPAMCMIERRTEPQQEVAKTEDSAKLETQNKSCDDGNINMECQTNKP